MDSRVAALLNAPVYEDFDATSELVQEKDGDTVLLHLPGFRKEHLKVQLTSAHTVRISGSRPIGDNKWKRFKKDFPVTPNHDTQKISAKYEGGILYVKLPMKKEEKQESKLPATDPTTTPHEKPADQPLTPKISVQEQASEKPAPQDDSSKQTKAQDVKEEPKAAKEQKVEPAESEKKAEKSPEEKSRGLDDGKKKSIPGDKGEDDSAKKSTPEKTSGLDDGKKKSIADDKGEDDSVKAAEKRENGRTETVDGTGTGRTENYKETAVEKLKKHRRILNLTLVVIFATTLGLYITNFIRSLKRNEN